MDNNQPSKKKRNIGLYIATAIMVLIIAYGVYSFMSQPSAPDARGIYGFITENFNTTLAKGYSLSQMSVITVNSTIHINSTNITFSFPANGKTYIYYFGADFSPPSAAESYVVYSFIHNMTSDFPAYPENATLAGFNIPSIEAEISANNLTAIDVPYSAQQASTASQSASQTAIVNWLVKNLNYKQQYIFSFGGGIPGVYVVKTIPETYNSMFGQQYQNKTVICEAYIGIGFSQYNASTTAKFIGYKTNNVTIGSVLPSIQSMNSNLNQLAACYNYVSKWKG